MRRRFALLLSLAPACTTDSAPPLATPVIETLPNGAKRVSNPGPAAWRDTAGWRLVEAGRIGGEVGTPGEIINPMMLEVDDAGRVYVVDRSPAAIKVYAPDGSFVRAIGRDGEGPGEFRAPFIAIRGSQIAVHDPRLSRTSLFDTSGTFIRSWSSTCCYWTAPGFDRTGRVVIPLVSTDEATAIRYVRYDTLGRALDTLSILQAGTPKSWVVSEKGRRMMMVRVPFSPAVVHELDAEGGVLVAWSGTYEIIRSNTGRDTALIFGRTWTPQPVTTERRRAEVEAMIQQQAGDIARETLERTYRLDEVPATLPAFNAFLQDGDGNLWVITDADSTRTALDVFDRSGAFLGSTTAPFLISGYGLAAWGRDGLYLVAEGDDGNPGVTRYRIAKEAGRRN